MSTNMHEDDSEVAEGFTRVLRTVMMGAMQVREANERKQQARERQAERAESAAKAEQAERTRIDGKTASAIQREVQSSTFWNHSSNDRIAQTLSVAQHLARSGKHPEADAAYMLGADVIRDKFNVNVDAIMKGPGTDADHLKALMTALDNHNASGRLRDEAQEAEMAEDRSAQDVENAAETPKYSDQLLTAAATEAKEADMPVEVYLDSLSDDQRQTLSQEHDQGIEDSVHRDDRLEAAATSKAEAEATNSVSEVPEKTFDTKGEIARDDAALADKAEAEQLTAAAQALPGSDHQKSMDRHLSGVARKDPQAAQARGQALKNVPGSGKDYVQKSMDSKATPRKAAGQKQTPAREHVHQR